MNRHQFYVAIDLGAGEGAKIGVFAPGGNLLGQTGLSKTLYGGSAEALADALTAHVYDYLSENGARREAMRGIGIASAGLLRSDDSYLLAANIPFLNGHNLRSLLEERTGVPVVIENDANAGGLAEWSVLRVELLYWVFGGGWGGAWISRDGKVRFPTRDWDGNDASLHYSDEPGYAIPLEKIMLRTLFAQNGVSFERFEQNLEEESGGNGNLVLGPCGSRRHLRAEVILSGPGRCRLFRAIVGDDDYYENFLDIHETCLMNDPSVAGKLISKLSRMRVEAAVETDRIFGRILAEATRILFKRARADGLPEGIPICLGGKPSYALPYFGPSAQRALGHMGILSYMRPSIIDERGSNANLVGAAVLVETTVEKRAIRASASPEYAGRQP